MVEQLSTCNPQLTTREKVYNVSTKTDDLIRKAEQGERVKMIREARGMTGEQFAAELMAVAKSFGLRMRYGKDKVSRLERGGRSMTAAEVAMLTLIDKEERDAIWLVFGDVSRSVIRA